jgi:ubiquinone/menaquinone biosynthesis C-methylase UbiE
MEVRMKGTNVSPALLAAEIYEKTVVANTMLPFATYLLEIASPQPGERLVDVACGTGAVVRQAVEMVGPGGAVVGVDVNPAMLAVGQAALTPNSSSPVVWREGDALALPLEDNSTDVATCSHGLPFVADRVAALREMYRVLRPGGRAVAAVWRSLEHNPVSHTIWAATARHLETPVESLVPAFSLGNAETLCNLFEAGEFTDVSVHVRRHTVREPYDPQFVERFLATLGDMVPRYSALHVHERAELVRAITDETAPALQHYVDGSDLLRPYAAYVILGRKQLV